MHEKGLRNIMIGPLADGNVYRYEMKEGVWWNDDGPAAYIPHEYVPDDGIKRRVYFDTDAHKWLDENYVRLPVDESVSVDCDFRDTHGLNGEVRLFCFD